MKSLKANPYSFGCDEGPRFKSLGASFSIKANSQQTGGDFNLFDVACPSDYATPLHIHYIEDVAVYVLEGVLTFYWGNEKRTAVAGSFFYQPRGIPHGFRVEGATPARILYLTIPSGFDRLVMNLPRLALKAELETAMAGHKIEVLGPLPE